MSAVRRAPAASATLGHGGSETTELCAIAAPSVTPEAKMTLASDITSPIVTKSDRQTGSEYI